MSRLSTCQLKTSDVNLICQLESGDATFKTPVTFMLRMVGCNKLTQSIVKFRMRTSDRLLKALGLIWQAICDKHPDGHSRRGKLGKKIVNCLSSFQVIARL